MKDLLLPAAAFIFGVVSLYVNPDDRKKRWVLISCLMLTAGLTISSNLLDAKKHSAELDDANRQNRETRQILLNVTSNTKDVPDLVTLLRNVFGYSSQNASQARPEDIGRSFEANEARGKLLAKKLLATSAGKLVEKVTVEYFPKNVEGDVVVKALRDSGFEVNMKRPQNDEPTNAIWAGDRVSVDDVKLVALTLIRAGVQLKSIRRFRESGGPKANLVQVGADPARNDFPTLSVNDVHSLASIAR